MGEPTPVEDIWAGKTATTRNGLVGLTQILRVEGGLGGHRVASDGMDEAGLLKTSTSGAAPPASTDDLKEQVRLAIMLMSWCNTELVVTARVFWALHGEEPEAMGEPLSASVRGKVLEFQDSFHALMTASGLRELVEPRPDRASDESFEVARRIGSAMQVLPPLPDGWPSLESLQIPAEGQDGWPFWDFGDAPQDCDERVLALCTRHTIQWIGLLPEAACVHLVGLLLSLTRNQLQGVTLCSYMRAEMASHEFSFCSEERLEAIIREARSLKYSGQDGGQANALRQANRFITGATILTSAVGAMALVWARFAGAETAEFRWGPPIGAPCARPGSPYLGEGPNAARVGFAALASSIVLRTENELQLRWSFSKPGTSKLSGKYTEAGGLAFINAQMRRPDSRFKMPEVSASHRAWEAWFFKIKGFRDSCPLLESQCMIDIVTASLDRDDRRIFGWSEGLSESGEETRSFQEFLDHVAKQVLSTNTTRHEAARQLETLESALERLPDCVTLATQIKQLVGQLYPQMETGEAEPFPRRTAVMLIHKAMCTLSTKKSQAAVVQAWQALTSYDSSETFYKYVDESLHRGAETAAVTTAYVKEICKHLERAHCMYVQIHSSRIGTSGPNVTVPGQVAANWPSLAGSPYITPEHGSRGRGRGRGGRTGARGGRQGTVAAMPAPSYQPYGRGGRAPARGGRQGRGAGRPSPQPGTAFQLPHPPAGPAPALPTARKETMAELTHRVIQAMSPAFPVGAALAPGSRPTPDAARRTIDAGGCMLCMEAGHYAQQCPKALGNPECARFMNEFKRVRKSLP